MDYTIMHVNNRAKKEMQHNKKLLENFRYIDDIAFVNGNMENAKIILESLGIKTDSVWGPKDGRPFGPSPGEYGVWLSTLNVFEYIVKNKTEKLLVLEDDVLISKDFKSQLEACEKDLPKDWSFLSMYTTKDDSVDNFTDIGSRLIHRSNNQHAFAQAMLYSYSGAKKILDRMYNVGMKTVNDDFIFDQSRNMHVDGYTIRPDIKPVVFHRTELPSVIDVSGKRNGFYYPKTSKK